MSYKYDIEIVEGRKLYHFRIRSARNNKILCHSEKYASKQMCLKTARKIHQDLSEAVIV